MITRAAQFLRSTIADRGVLYGVLGAARGFFTGPITAIIIVFSLTHVVQGYYYTFASLVTLQIFLELGFAQVILQFASHEWAFLELRHDRSITGEPKAMARFAGLMRMAIKWYVRGGVVLWLGLAAAGIAFFGSQNHPGVDWLGPWLVVVSCTVADFVLLPLWSLMQGANQIHAVNFARFMSGVLLLPVIWGGLLAGVQLWALALAEVVGLAWDIGYLWRYRRFFISLREADTTSTISWRHEILPVQWRIAVSWISGYFSFFLFTPAIFGIVGATAAGRWGMTWAAASTIMAIASTWISTKAPVFGSLIARRRYKELDDTAKRVTISALVVSAVLGALAVGVIALLNVLHLGLATRVLPLGPSACLFLAVVLIQVSIAQSTYLRAHRAEPFALLSLLQGAAIAITTVALGSLWGTAGVAAGYLAVVALLVLPLGTRIFLRRRREWHATVASVGLDEERLAVT